MYKLEKEFWISCSHRLHNNELTDEENMNIFGKCNRLPSHGHNYKVILKLKTKEVDPVTGMIVNFYELKSIFNEIIDIPFDHQCLNVCPEFENIVPTAENMCKVFFDLLKPHIKELYAIKIYETEGASACFCE